MASQQEALTAWVAEALGVPCEYGEFPPTEPPHAMVKVSPGDPVVRRYRSGGGVYRLPYEVYLKVSATTQAERIAGLETLRALSDAIGRGERPAGPVRYTGHAVDVAPSLYAESGGTESVYQMTAHLTYIVTIR